MNDQQIEILKLEIGKLSLGENDYLILKIPAKYKDEIIGDVRQTLKTFSHELASKTLIITDEIEVYTLNEKKR